MYEIIFYVGLVSTGIFLLLSILLFVKNDVFKLIGDVTGWNAKKALKRMHKETPAASVGLKESVKATGKKIEKDSKRKAAEDKKAPEDPEEETELLPVTEGMESFPEEEPTDLLPTGEEMELLSHEEATELLTGEETEILSGNEPTTVLRETATGDEVTTVLYEESVHILSDSGISILDQARPMEMPDSVSDKLQFAATEDAITMSYEEEEETSVLRGEDTMTEVLETSDTEALHKEMATLTMEELPMPGVFQPEEDVVVVHTKERITDA